MEKPKRKSFWDITIETTNGKIYGGGDIYNAGYDAVEKYYSWYIKTHCIKKEDLPDVEDVEFIEEAAERVHKAYCKFKKDFDNEDYWTREIIVNQMRSGKKRIGIL